MVQLLKFGLEILVQRAQFQIIGLKALSVLIHPEGAVSDLLLHASLQL